MNEGNRETPAKIVIFGTGDIADLARFYFTHDSPHEVVAFCADRHYISSDRHAGLPLVAFESLPNTHPPDEVRLFVALSYRNVNRVRAEKYTEGKSMGYQLASYISSKLVNWVEPAAIGDNCFILENQTIQPFVEIGNNVTLWSGNHIGHHSRIGDHCFISSHVVISGHVTIGSHCFLGVNATLRDGIRIGDKTVLGAGAVVQKNTEENSVYMARPAMRAKQSADEIDYFKES